MEGLDKKEEPNTRENTAEEYLIASQYYTVDIPSDSVVLIDDAREAIRLSKIEALKKVLDIVNYQYMGIGMNDKTYDAITKILNAQITQLKNGK